MIISFAAGHMFLLFKWFRTSGKPEERAFCVVDGCPTVDWATGVRMHLVLVELSFVLSFSLLWGTTPVLASSVVRKFHRICLAVFSLVPVV